MHIHGIIPPVATPMLANEDLDLPRLRTHIDELLAAGVHGIFVLGTNSEFYALDEGEKQEVIATAVEHVHRRVPVYAGTGAETTREAVRLTKMAEREGADGVSVITPYFIQPKQSEIHNHYRRIAESTHLPVILYSNPGPCGGVKIDVDTVVKLADVPNILAIKDSSGDQQNTNELIRAVPDRFSVLVGRDTLIWQGLLFGAKGAVPASANVAPALCVGIYEEFQRGNLDAAKAAQVKLNPLRLAFTLGTQPGAVKAALDLMGKSIGPSRGPIAPLPPDQQQKLKSVLQEMGLL
jgi:4-hydroxy-tetrahydrodipicolinate synthase